jgi:predicted DNA-binding transcriptional regulator AlpA
MRGLMSPDRHHDGHELTYDPPMPTRTAAHGDCIVADHGRRRWPSSKRHLPRTCGTNPDRSRGRAQPSAARCRWSRDARHSFGWIMTMTAPGGKDLSAATDLLSIPETARRIGLHADTLYRLCRTGQFPPAIQIGGRWRVSVPRLARYLHGDATSTHELGTPVGLELESQPEESRKGPRDRRLI